MAIYFKIGEKFPKDCGKCPLFVDSFEVPAFCVGEGEPTEEEIDAEEDGNLNMYYTDIYLLNARITVHWLNLRR